MTELDSERPVEDYSLGSFGRRTLAERNEEGTSASYSGRYDSPETDNEWLESQRLAEAVTERSPIRFRVRNANLLQTALSLKPESESQTDRVALDPPAFSDGQENTHAAERPKQSTYALGSCGRDLGGLAGRNSTSADEPSLDEASDKTNREDDPDSLHLQVSDGSNPQPLLSKMTVLSDEEPQPRRITSEATSLSIAGTAADEHRGIAPPLMGSNSVVASAVMSKSLTVSTSSTPVSSNSNNRLSSRRTLSCGECDDSREQHSERVRNSAKLQADSSDTPGSRHADLLCEEDEIISAVHVDCSSTANVAWRTLTQADAHQRTANDDPHLDAENTSLSTIFPDIRSAEAVESLRQQIQDLEAQRARLLSELDLMRLNMERRFRVVEREIAETKLSIIRSLSSEGRSERLEVSESAVSEFPAATQIAVHADGSRIGIPHEKSCDDQIAANSSMERNCIREHLLESNYSLTAAQVSSLAPSRVSDGAKKLRMTIVQELHKMDIYGNMLKAWQTVFKPAGKHVDWNLFRIAVIKILRNHWLADRKVSDAEKLMTTFTEPPDEIIYAVWKDIVGEQMGATMQWKHFVDLYGSMGV